MHRRLFALLVLAIATTRQADAEAGRLDRWQMELDLQPQGHGLSARATVGTARPLRGTVTVVLAETLQLDGVAVPGGPDLTLAEIDGDDGVRRWAIELPEGATTGLELSWHGELVEDVEAGERRGAIHNHEVRAHIGPRGVFLSGEVPWYPRIDRHRPAPLALFDVRVRAPFPVVASGNVLDERGGHFLTPHAAYFLTVAGGPLEEHRLDSGTTVLRALLRPESAGHAARLLEAAASYLTLFEPRLGRYPFSHFTVVENFFSSGFAFPGFTLLSSEVIQMGPRGLRPGYLDHEMVHSWFGNSVLSKRGSSHWSEGIATFCANYMRPVLEGDPDRARDQRRGIVEALSREPRRGRRRVASFGVDRETGPFIGYQKAAMVLAQLTRSIGDDAVWKGLEHLATTRRGMPSDWHDVRRSMETVSGAALQPFFDYWIFGPGLPDLHLDRSDSGRDELNVTSSAPLALTLPIEIDDDAGSRRTLIEVGDGGSPRSWPIPPGSLRLRVDPDFEVLRQLPSEILMPTIAAMTARSTLAVIHHADDADRYRMLLDFVHDQYPDGESLRFARRLRRHHRAEGNVLVLGRAAARGRTRRLLAAAGVEIGERTFRVGEEAFAAPGHSLLACVRNPLAAGAVICSYFGNTPAAVERSYLIPFYDANSIVVFEDGLPVLRRDLELVQQVDLG